MEGTKRPLDRACLEDRMIAETVCSAVSVAGLGIAAVTAYRKRFLTATRIAAYSLIPLGLVMTGFVDWAAHTAFSPTAWAGFEPGPMTRWTRPRASWPPRPGTSTAPST
ncbi:hypothetical protein ABTX35_32410, partial [Streptomyces sp. NPDC096080]